MHSKYDSAVPQLSEVLQQFFRLSITGALSRPSASAMTYRPPMVFI